MNNQYNIYCLNCRAWKLHTKGRKYYTCLTCNTRVDRASAIQPPLMWGDPETQIKIAAAQALRAIPSDKRSQASRENGKKGGRPKNRLCPVCKKSVPVYRFADEWRFGSHFPENDSKYACGMSYAVAE